MSSDGRAFHAPSRAAGRLLDDLTELVLQHDPEYQRFGPFGTRIGHQQSASDAMINYIIDAGDEPARPEEVFPRLRWGGLYIYTSRRPDQVLKAQQLYHNQGGFIVETAASPFRSRWMGLPLPGLTRRGSYMAARKLDLIPPGVCTDRFTYHVQLERKGQDAHGKPQYVVAKEVPTYENVLWRLCEKHPQLDDKQLSKRARKLVDSVFPVFLTREAAILQILQRNMPAPYSHRLPEVVGIEKDERGFVRKLHLNWLRMSGPLLRQIDFARQSVDLLRVLHDHGGMIHLDLRLDNIVIAHNGVCFVDFGSAVRVGENISESALLTSLFEEMMRTSEIQRLLHRWMDEGRVTSEVIRDKLHKVDKAIDFFYLAVQINRPHFHPEFRGLVQFDRESEESKLISGLTGAILRPRDPANPSFRSAEDILKGIEQIERKLTTG